MSGILLTIINTLAYLITIIVLIDTLLSWVLPPFHPIREFFGRILHPLYAPIRRVIPPMGMMDITPLVLVLLVQVVARIATSILR